MRCRIAVLTAVLMILAACGNDGGSDSDGAGTASSFRGDFTNAEIYPVVANADLAVGKNRFILGINNANDAPIGEPNIDVSVDFYDLDESATEPVSTKNMQFIWSIKPLVGLYVAEVSFESAGEWGAEVDMAGAGYDESLKMSFNVKTDSSTPAIGEKPPPSTNLTLDAVNKISAITTDKTPDRGFYQATVKEALASGDPFVVIFATPKFCQSQTCGPMLDIFQDVAKDYRALTFIHIEPYRLPADPSNLQPVQAAAEWGLPSEPWAFVVDGKGQVSAKFEGAVAPPEVRKELDAL